MLLRFLRTALACAILTALGFGVAMAQTAPTPGPSTTTDRSGGAPAAATTPAPGFDPLGIKGLTFSGTLRAYDFNRINIPEYNGAKKPAATGPNRYAFNFGGDLRADYKIGNSPFAVGGALWGAFPFGLDGGSVGCNVFAGKGKGSVIVNESQGQCAKNNAGIDNSLPGYALETFEYYVKYNDPTAAITIGNQLLNKPWMPSSDSRIKPSLYQGLDATINLSKSVAIGLTAVTRFEDRTESEFDQCTLITCTGTTPAGIGSIVNVAARKGSITTGADRVALLFKPSPRASVTTEVYEFHNIADLTYFETKYYLDPPSSLNPFFGFQFVNEQQTGTAIVGRVSNQTTGLQLGVSPAKSFLLTVGADYAPWQYDTVAASSASAATADYFLPASVTDVPLSSGPNGAVNGSAVTAQKVGPGLYRVAYGGIASPYTDSYASDPLYTTSISQGMVERRSAGFSAKAALTYTSPTKRIVIVASEASYNYDAFIRNRTYEFDADATFNFNKVRAGTYKGLSLRERFADRKQPVLPYNFLYVRHQLQYSF